MLKRIFFYLALILIVLVGLESISRVGLYILKEYKNVFTTHDLPFNYTPEVEKTIQAYVQKTPETLEDKYTIMDPDLGWTLGPNAIYGAVDGIIIGQTNSIGTRNSKEYALYPPEGMIRIATFGDSFTHGSSMPNRLTWQELLEKQDERLEVLNFGVSGYGLDQAYLRYLKEGVPTHPDIVFICFMSEMMARNVNRFVSFYWRQDTRLSTKPRYIIKNGELELLKNPIRSYADYAKFRDPSFIEELAQTDFWSGIHQKKHFWDHLASYHLAKLAIRSAGLGSRSPVSGNELRHEIFPADEKHWSINAQSEAFEITKLIFDKFYRDVEAHGSIPVIVFLPSREVIQIYIETNKKIYDPLLDYLYKQQGYRVIDTMNILAPAVRKFGMFEISQSHYKPSGHNFIVYYLEQSLIRGGLIDNTSTVKSE